MRVIAGRFRSRKIASVRGLETRPTPDRLRESMFSILAPRIEGMIFLDAYAGSGAVGIEAISRGARHVILIERNAVALATIRENLRALGIESEVTVARGRAVALVKKYRADIAFVDPPYEELKEYSEVLMELATSRCPLVITQHASRAILADEYGPLKRFRVLRQGDNSLSFYERMEDESAGKKEVDIHDVRSGRTGFD